MNKLEVIEINPAVEPCASVIWLHGLGASGHDFVDIVPQLQLPAEMVVRFIFPHAPVRPVTLNNGYKMRAWFDVYGLTETAPLDQPGINESGELVTQLIEQELQRGVANDKIVVAGFSQGGAIALQSGLQYEKNLAGILVLSGFLALTDNFEKKIVNQAPILMMHGEFDNVVPIKWAEKSKQYLIEQQLQVQWLTYPMAHNVCLEEIEAISSWLQKVLT